MHGILAAHAEQLLPHGLAALYHSVPHGIVWTYLKIPIKTVPRYAGQTGCSDILTNPRHSWEMVQTQTDYSDILAVKSNY